MLKKKIINLKDENKINENKEIEKLNHKIIHLISEIEIEKSKIENMNKKYKKLEERYFKISSELRKKPHEDLYFQSKRMKEERLGLNHTIKNKSQSNIINTLPLIKPSSKVDYINTENNKIEEDKEN